MILWENTKEVVLRCGDLGDLLCTVKYAVLSGRTKVRVRNVYVHDWDCNVEASAEFMREFETEMESELAAKLEADEEEHEKQRHFSSYKDAQ